MIEMAEAPPTSQSGDRVTAQVRSLSKPTKGKVMGSWMMRRGHSFGAL